MYWIQIFEIRPEPDVAGVDINRHIRPEPDSIIVPAFSRRHADDVHEVV